MNKINPGWVTDRSPNPKEQEKLVYYIPDEGKLSVTHGSCVKDTDKCWALCPAVTIQELEDTLPLVMTPEECQDSIPKVDWTPGNTPDKNGYYNITIYDAEDGDPEESKIDFYTAGLGTWSRYANNVIIAYSAFDYEFPEPFKHVPEAVKCSSCLHFYKDECHLEPGVTVCIHDPILSDYYDSTPYSAVSKRLLKKENRNDQTRTNRCDKIISVR